MDPMWQTNHKQISSLSVREGDIDGTGWMWHCWHGRREGCIVPSGGNRCSHPVNPACNKGEHSKHTGSHNTNRHTERQRQRGTEGCGLECGPAQEDHQTPPWGSHKAAVNSWDTYINMMKCIKRQRGNPYQWYVSTAKMVDSLNRVICCNGMLPQMCNQLVQQFLRWPK